MQLLNEIGFKNIVQTLLYDNNINYRDVQSINRKVSLLTQSPFLTCLRNHYKHIPDLLIESNIPCELKSSKELYGSTHFSRAHLISYLFQIIYGQCLSYADLFRPNDNLPLAIYLIIPQIIEKNHFGSTQETFDIVLEENAEIYNTQMAIDEITFSSPQFAIRCHNGKYGQLGTGSDTILITKIEYLPNNTNSADAESRTAD